MYQDDDSPFSFPRMEEDILTYWIQIDAFKESIRQSEGKPEFTFYDGPPFATGLPHYGHILAGTIKDVVTRFAHQTGHHVTRRFGWDCHGLPVEYEIDQKLGIKCKDDVLKYGIDKYNEECRSIVMRYSSEWQVVVTRLGRWIDFENDYKTMEPWYMESVWWVFKELWEKNLVYRGFKVMPYSTSCSTPLSNFEAGLNYKDVSDPAITVCFPLVDSTVSFLAWTTTPWTLPANVALCVNPKMTYILVKDFKYTQGDEFWLAESRIVQLYPASGQKVLEKPYTILTKCKGVELSSLKYVPIFDFFVEHKDAAGFWRVCADDYVTDDNGTGIVHLAPAFGEDDYRVCLENGLITENSDILCPVDDDGRFYADFEDIGKMNVKEADKIIIKILKGRKRVLQVESIVHSYPFCWRSDTPLIYKAVPSWFVSIKLIKERLIANNDSTSWIPSFVGEKRFKNWLLDAKDWAISRNRFWGTPLPVWTSADYNEVIAFGSIKDLESASGEIVSDLHRHKIDHILVPATDRSRPPLRRVEEVFDCWFESGSMPYAHMHYPFENKSLFDENFPGDFVAEGLDQTRGWFYTLSVLSTALFDKPPFKNVICSGLVLASDGKKMSKRLKNYPDPMNVINKYGSDSLRMYLINSPVVRAEKLAFKEDGVRSILKDVLIPWFNVYRFFVQCWIPSKVHILSLSNELSLHNILDKWILSSIHDLLSFIHTEMSCYRLYTVVPRLVSFIDKFTNIYVRYNRERCKCRHGQKEYDSSMSTLYFVLSHLSKVMSPFLPFFSEYMFQELRKFQNCEYFAGDSVHYHMLPLPDEKFINDRILKSVDTMQSAVELGRSIREKFKISLKFPLKSLTISLSDNEIRTDIDNSLVNYIKEQVNVLEVIMAEESSYCTSKLEPQWNSFGKRFGKMSGRIAGILKECDERHIQSLESTGTLTVDGHKLTFHDVKIVRKLDSPPVGWDVAAKDGLVVALRIEQDDDLREEGHVRELLTDIQKMRKSSRLNRGDMISLFYDVNDVKDAQIFMNRNVEKLEFVLGCSIHSKSLLPTFAVKICESVVRIAGLTVHFTLTRNVPFLYSTIIEADLLCWLKTRGDEEFSIPSQISINGRVLNTGMNVK